MAAEIPTTTEAIEAFDRHLRELEARARREGGAFWDSERNAVYEATNFAFLLRSLRNLLLILGTQHLLLDDLRQQAAHRAAGCRPGSPGSLRLHAKPHPATAPL